MGGYPSAVKDKEEEQEERVEDHGNPGVNAEEAVCHTRFLVLGGCAG